tara:strand:- start:402 stop:578 length:177 start_codon:yes stop_codon:yes gene_type:complete
MNPYYNGVLIFERDLLPKELINDDIALMFLEEFGGVEVRLCKITDLYMMSAPAKIYQY